MTNFTSAVDVALKAAAKFWQVPLIYLQVDRGVETILFVSALFDKDVLKAVRLCENDLNPSLFGSKPECAAYPVAAVICERPVLNQNKIVRTWVESGLDAALKVSKPNPVLRRHGRCLVEFATRFVNFYDLVGKEVSGWQFDRLRQPRYLQHSWLRAGEEELDLSFAELLKRLPDEKRPRFSDTGFVFQPPGKERKTPSLPQKVVSEYCELFASNGIRDESEVTQGLMAIEAAIMYEAENTYFGTSGLETVTTTNDNLKFTCAASRSDLRFFPCTVPTGGALGPGEIERVIEQAKHDAFHGSANDRHIAVSLLVSCATWHPLDDLRSLKLDGGFVCSSVSLRECLGSDPMLHLPTKRRFWRRLPKLLEDVFPLAQNVAEEDAAKYLRGINQEFTISRLREALLNVCPTAFRYHPALPVLGFYPYTAESVPVRAYCRISAESLISSQGWIHLFDPEDHFSCRPFPNFITACGSPNVPDTMLVRRMFSETMSLLLSPLPTSSFQDALVAYNAGVSCFFLFAVVALSGLRNWPMDLPSRAGQAGSVGYQKGVIRYMPSRLLVENLPACHRRLAELEELASRDGISLDLLENNSKMLPIFQINKGKCKATPFSAKKIAENIFLSQRTRFCSGLYSGAMRHWSMTVLYDSSLFAPIEIEAFHHRSHSALHPFRSHRLEAPTVTTRIEEYLCCVAE